MDKFIKLSDRPKSHAANVNAADRVKHSCMRIAKKCIVAPTTLFCHTNASPLFSTRYTSVADGVIQQRH